MCALSMVLTPSASFVFTKTSSMALFDNIVEVFRGILIYKVKFSNIFGVAVCFSPKLKGLL